MHCHELVNTTTIITLLLFVLLAFVVLLVIILLDHRKNAEQMSLLEGENSEGQTTRPEDEIPITIHESCKTGNLTEINQWISLGVDLNKKDEKGYAPLHYACEYGHEEVVQILLDRKTKVNILSKTTLLSPMACLVIGRLDNRLSEAELIKIIGALKKAGGDINPTSEEAVPPVKAVIIRGNLELLNFFMSLHVHIFVVDSDKRSMLHHIVLNPNENSMAITEQLVERGLDINAQDCDGNTPLHLAMV
ncbi:MAG TPA: ankyrin repeat domain-containing protein, partial [Verrucomicrobiota bacterium]|nr:ankyrin repeat domain-containing protein [Verrucomicrobiota bacterium]